MREGLRIGQCGGDAKEMDVDQEPSQTRPSQTRPNQADHTTWPNSVMDTGDGENIEGKR